MSEYLFSHIIDGKASWSILYRSIEAFAPLAEYILERHGLPRAELETLAPGTNAVFGAGGYVFKIFAPDESGFGVARDFYIELGGLTRAERLEIAVPSPVASGEVRDRYLFRYIVMRRVSGTPVCELADSISVAHKRRLGQSMRDITTRLNTPCEPDALPNALDCAEELSGFDAMPYTFRRERSELLCYYKSSPLVYVHGDLTGENVLVDRDGGYYMIDFADACIAPPEYELAPLVCELFRFDRACLEGYFGEGFDPESVAEQLTRGLVMHRFGYELIRARICDPRGLDGIGALLRAVRNIVKEGRST